VSAILRRVLLMELFLGNLTNSAVVGGRYFVCVSFILQDGYVVVLRQRAGDVIFICEEGSVRMMEKSSD
jgi:hypothetical protein